MDLNTLLIILGVIALLALVAHGLWSNRKEKSAYFKNADNFHRPSQTAVKPAPAVESAAVPSPLQTPLQTPPSSSFQSAASSETPVNPGAGVDYRYSEQTVDDIKISIPNTVASLEQPPSYNVTPAAEPHAAVSESIEKRMAAEISTASPAFVSPELRGELRETVAPAAAGELPTQPVVMPESPKPPRQTSGFIMLYIVAEHAQGIHGQQLAQALEHAGFLFGDKQMYHRHLDISPASPVLFSVANIEQPGTFDYYNMAEFSTMGIVLFMAVPSVGNDLHNLRTLIRTAKTLAADLNGVVLTDKQTVFDAAAEQDYLARVA